MRYKEFYTEHNIVPDQTFPEPDLNNAELFSKLRLKNGNFVDVYKKTAGNVMQLLAVDNKNILGFISLVLIPNRTQIAMVKNAQSYVQKQGIALNLIMIAKHKLRLRLISDYEMTLDGEATWQAMSNNPQLGVKIYNFDQDKIYDLNDPNIIKPEDDQYEDENKINWFYIIESNNKFPSIINNLVYQYYYELDSRPD